MSGILNTINPYLEYTIGKCDIIEFTIISDTSDRSTYGIVYNIEFYINIEWVVKLFILNIIQYT